MQLNVYWGLWSVGQPLCHSVTPPPHWRETTQTPGVYPLEDTGEVEKQQISYAALHRLFILQLRWDTLQGYPVSLHF